MGTGLRDHEAVVDPRRRLPKIVADPIAERVRARLQLRSMVWEIKSDQLSQSRAAMCVGAYHRDGWPDRMGRWAW